MHHLNIREVKRAIFARLTIQPPRLSGQSKRCHADADSHLKSQVTHCDHIRDARELTVTLVTRLCRCARAFVLTSYRQCHPASTRA